MPATEPCKKLGADCQIINLVPALPDGDRILTGQLWYCNPSPCSPAPPKKLALPKSRQLDPVPTSKNPLTKNRNQVESTVNMQILFLYLQCLKYISIQLNKCKNRKLPFSTKVQKHKLEHDNFKTYNVISQCFYYENRFVKQAP